MLLVPKRDIHMKTILTLVAALAISGCTRNIDKAKECAPSAAKQMGFEIVGYEGYELSLIYGGLAWYTMKKVPDNGVIYDAAFAPWSSECHVYSLQAIDAIKPR